MRRLLAIVPVLLGATIFAFALGHLAPGDVTSVLLGPYATQDDREALRAQLSLDRPLPQQYARWLERAIQGDLGESIQLQAPVARELNDRFWNTFILAATTFAVALVVGISLGVYTALRIDSRTDHLLQGGVAFFAYMPVFWLGVVLIYIFSFRLGWLPAVGSGAIDGSSSILDRLRHLVLPVIATMGIPAAIIVRSTRSAVNEQMDRDFVRTARAKGIGSRAVVRRHVLRAAAPPIIHVAGLQFAYLFAGSIVFTEVVFNWPGIGLAVYDAVSARDIPVIQGVVVLAAVVTVAANLLADVIHAAIDPRVRLSQSGS